jgi:hypothetical protein
MFGVGLSAALVLVACGSASNKSDAGSGGAVGSGGASTVDAAAGGAIDAGGDGGTDAPVACDLSKPFGTPVLVPFLGMEQDDIWLTEDSNTALLALNRTGLGCCGIFTTSRTATGDFFGTYTLLANINIDYSNRRPVLSSDQLTLFFEAAYRADANATSSNVIFVAKRNDPLADFGMPSPLPGENLAANEEPDSVSVDGHFLYLDAVVGTNRDIYLRDLTTSGPSTPIAELNSDAADSSAVISHDGRTIYFGTTRPLPGAAADAGRSLNSHVWVAHRSGATGTFSNPTPVTELNTSFIEAPNWLSPDGCTIYLSSNREPPGDGTAPHIWVASKPAN